MSKALKTAGTIIAGVALVATGIGAVALAVGGGVALGTGIAVASSATIAGISMSTLSAVGAGLAFLGDASAKPLKVGGTAGSQVDFAADPNAPIPYAIGRTGTGGRIVYATTGEAKNRNILYCAVLSGGAPHHAITGFKAGDEAVIFGELQQAVGGTYANRMWQNRQLGAMPSPAFGPPNTLDPAVLGEWTADHRLSGYAASWYVLGYDQKTYASGVPEAVWTVEGACVYDPRLDSTYAGGGGPHRIAEPDTWTWSENPWLHALAWSLGRYANGVRVLGIGARPALIDIPAVVEAANIADANGWKVGGVVYSNDSKWDVLKAMCQAGGGRPVQLGASITFLVNAPRVSLATLTPDDLAGGYSVQAAQSVRSRPNQIIPKYRSEAHGWEMVAAGPVKVAAYVAADRGRLRSREVSYPLVQDPAQVAQLAAYDLVNGREYGPVTVACKPGWMGFKRGDCITVSVPDLGMDGQKALILARTIDPMTGEVSLTLQSETDEKHDFALGRVASPPPVPGLTGTDPLPTAPGVGSWVAIGGVLASADGSKIPAIIVSGSSDDPNATHLIIEYREETVGGEPGSWVGTEYAVTAGRYELGVKSATRYRVRVRYRTIRGLEDTEVSLDLGLVTTGAMVAADTVKLGDKTAAEWLADMAGAQALADTAQGDAREAVLRILAETASAAGRDYVTEKVIRGAAGLPLGAVMVDQVRKVEESKQVIAEHYEELTARQDNAVAALTTEQIVRTSQTSALAADQVSLAATVAGNYAAATSTLAVLAGTVSTQASDILALSATFNSNVSTINSQLTTLSTAQGSQATSLLELTATAGSHTSQISIQASAVALLSGQVASSYGVNLTSDGVTIGFKGINNGQTGGWVFRGQTFGIETLTGGVRNPFFVNGSTVYLSDTVVDGDLMLTGSLKFSAAPEGEFSPATTYDDSTHVDLTASNQSCGGYAVYCAAGDLDVVTGLALQNSASTNGGASVGLYLDGVLIDEWSTGVLANFTERDSQTTTIPSPGVGWHTVQIRARAEGGATLRKVYATFITTNRRR